MVDVNTLTVLSEAGDYTVTWDPASEAEVALARTQYDSLRTAGYSIYVLTELAEFDPLGARFEVRTVAAPAPTPADRPTRRGRRGLGGTKGEVATAFDPAATAAIAVPQMRGG